MPDNFDYVKDQEQHDEYHQENDPSDPVWNKAHEHHTYQNGSLDILDDDIGMSEDEFDPDSGVY